jgi:hypothetical protein
LVQPPTSCAVGVFKALHFSAVVPNVNPDKQKESAGNRRQPVKKQV